MPSSFLRTLRVSFEFQGPRDVMFSLLNKLESPAFVISSFVVEFAMWNPLGSVGIRLSQFELQTRGDVIGRNFKESGGDS